MRATGTSRCEAKEQQSKFALVEAVNRSVARLICLDYAESSGLDIEPEKEATDRGERPSPL